uniref:MI domain-containing protein n=1 Tax=Trichobilharzia regenti TaxID=157069 RepID=A0AA85JRA7_TRIRE|nr:unnamed protein product [Trichobilharzia regenti]
MKSFISLDGIDEAPTALLEIVTLQIHHVSIFQKIMMAIEIGVQLAREHIMSLLSELCSSVVLTIDQLTLGIRNVCAELPDFQLNVPVAYILTESIMNKVFKEGFWP